MEPPLIPETLVLVRSKNTINDHRSQKLFSETNLSRLVVDTDIDILTRLPCVSHQRNSRMPHIDAQCVKGNQTPQTRTEKVTNLAIYDRLA